MGIEIPDEVKWLAAKVVGTEWPSGDETALRDLGELWTRAGKTVRDLGENGDTAAKAVLAAMAGRDVEAFRQYWAQFPGEGKAFDKLAKYCDTVADACKKTAATIEYTKLSIIAALVILAAQIAMLIASAAGTFGASTAGIPIAMAATRGLVVRILINVGQQIALNVAINLIVDSVIQLSQMGAGHRDEWDAGKTGKAVQAGAIGGLFGGAVGGAGMAASARVAANAGRAADDQIGSSLGNKVAHGVDSVIGVNSTNFGNAFGKGLASGAIAGAGGNLTNDWVNNKFSFKGLDVGGSLVAGAAQGAPGGALGGMSDRHSGLSDAGRNSDPTYNGRWNSSNAQILGELTPPANNGIVETDDYPRRRAGDLWGQ